MSRIVIRLLLSLLLCGLWLSPSLAAVLTVAPKAPCPGTGTSDHPYCTLQAAFTRARAGDTIRLRSGQYNESAKAKHSGTKEHPITVEPEDGHHPVLRFGGKGAVAGAVEIRHVDYWVIRGLTFDGTGLQTSTWAIAVRGKGHVIEGNTIRGWGSWSGNTSGRGASAIFVGHSHGVQVRRNHISASRTTGIKILTSDDTLVEANKITGMQCGRNTEPKTGAYASAAGMRIGMDGTRTTIRTNHIWAFVPTCDLSTPGYNSQTGILCDVGATHGVVERNTITDLQPRIGPKRAVSQGIFIESRCHDWRVTNNTIHKIGQVGLRNSSKNVGNADRTMYQGNVITEVGRSALVVERGQGIRVLHNTFGRSQEAVVHFAPDAVAHGQHQIDHNTYVASPTEKIGRWGSTQRWTLKHWQQRWGHDHHGHLTAAPLREGSAIPGAEIPPQASAPDAGHSPRQ